MPRHSCPNNQDCFIDCLDGGYAYFIEPDGPCECGCHGSSFGTALIGLGMETLFKTRTSGSMSHFPVKAVGEFASKLDRRSYLLLSRTSIVPVVELSRLAQNQRGGRMSANWTEASFDQLLAVLYDGTQGIVYD